MELKNNLGSVNKGGSCLCLDCFKLEMNNAINYLCADLFRSKAKMFYRFFFKTLPYVHNRIEYKNFYRILLDLFKRT